MSTFSKFLAACLVLVTHLTLHVCPTTSGPVSLQNNSSMSSPVLSHRASSSQPNIITWVLGFAFVTIISLSSLIGVLVIPLPKISSSCGLKDTLSTSYVHNFLEGLALGSLLASSIFHLMPHSFDLVGQG